MKITEEIEETIKTTIVLDYICNQCGESCMGTEKMNPCGLIEVQVGGAYDSPVIGDCTELKFSLCEYCLGKLFSQFKHPPECVSSMFCSPPVAWVDGKPVYEETK